MLCPKLLESTGRTHSNFSIFLKYLLPVREGSEGRGRIQKIYLAITLPNGKDNYFLFCFQGIIKEISFPYPFGTIFHHVEMQYENVG